MSPRPPARRRWPCGAGCAWGVVPSARCLDGPPDSTGPRSPASHAPFGAAANLPSGGPTWTCPCRAGQPAAGCVIVPGDFPAMNVRVGGGGMFFSGVVTGAYVVRKSVKIESV